MDFCFLKQNEVLKNVYKIFLLTLLPSQIKPVSYFLLKNSNFFAYLFLRKQNLNFVLPQF
jgi:hypothetical protein